LSALLTYNADGVPLYVKAKPFIKRAGVLLDVGAGVRPQRFVECDRHVCMEAHDEYCDVLRANGFETICAAVPAGLVGFDMAIDSVVAIDVIEHLTREDGLAAVAEMVRIARGQVVIFTPLGFLAQDGGVHVDPWGYQGQHWQAHRSGWTPDDFPGWRCFVDEDFHTRERGFKFGAFFAIWDRKK
jgi:hypothetical protein